MNLPTRKCSQNLIELFYLVGMLRSLSPGDSISVALRKLLQGGGEKSGYIQVCNKGSRQSEHQRSGIKLRNLAFYVWEDASLWAHWIHSFHMHLSYLVRANPISLFTLFLAFPPLLNSHCGEWQQALDCSFGSPHSLLEARNHWWLWHFLPTDMAGNIPFLKLKF